MVKWCGTLVPVFVAILSLCVSESHAQTVRDDMAFLAKPANVQPTYDTMLELARGYDLGYTEVAVANLKVDPWSPASGADLILPTQQILPAVPRRGIVINLADQRLYYYSPDSVLRFTAPVGIGGMDGETPTGQTKVVNKRVNPTWYPTPSIRKRHPEMPAVVPPGPDNPLGTLALYLGWPTYLIHGTNRPLSIGRRLTSGCIRLYPKDIKTLFSLVKEGTPVMVIDQPVKVGWLDGELYLQVHPSQKQAEEVEATGKFTPEPASDLAWLIVSKAGDAVGRIDWRLVERAAEERNGIAIKITAPRQPDRHMAAGEP